jgi:hypothetical protein
MTNIKKCFILFILFSHLLAIAQSNEGTEFWATFMPHVDKNTNSKVIMVTSKFTTSGTIRIPALSYSITFNVSSFSVAQIEIPQIAQLNESEVRSEMTAIIETKAPCAVYIHQYSNRRSEASIVLPKESLGKSYYVVTYQGHSNNGQNYNCHFSVIATEDNTSITINPKAPTVNGKAPDIPFEITLNRGEAYMLIADAQYRDFTGSRVDSDKPVAVFSGAPWTGVPSGCSTWDNLIEQMYPISTWGKEFVAAPSMNAAADYYRILAAEDNTIVQSNGNTYNLNAGEYESFRHKGGLYVKSEKPILVAQYLMGSSCTGYRIGDPSILLLNSFEQNKDTIILFNSSLQAIEENYINIIVRTDDIERTQIDKNPISSQALEKGEIVGTPYSFYTFKVNAGSHLITNQGCGVIATAYGYGQAESYAYGGGANFRDLSIAPIVNEGGCLGDSIKFEVTLSNNKAKLNWDFGDGSTSSLFNPAHLYKDTGTYIVKLQVLDICNAKTTNYTQNIIISYKKPISFTGDTILCENDKLILEPIAKPHEIIIWKGAKGANYTSKNFEIDKVRLLNDDTYTLTAIDKGCVSLPNTFKLKVHPLPLADLPGRVLYCHDPVAIKLKENYNVSWSNGGNSKEIFVFENMKIKVNYSDKNNCENFSLIDVKRFCPTMIFMPNSFSPTSQSNNLLYPRGENFDGYVLSISGMGTPMVVR